MKPVAIEGLQLQRFGEAQKRHSQGDVLGALRIYQQLLDALPTQPALLTYAALALSQLGREDAAKAMAQRALAALPARGAVAERVVLSTVLRRLGQLAEAEQILREALAESPNAAARNNLALVLMQRGQFDEADRLFAEAQAELPEDAAPALNRMRIALARSDYEAAEARLQEAKDIQPGHLDIPLMEARLALAEADPARAARVIFTTLKRVPTHMEAAQVVAALPPEAVALEPLEDWLAALVRAKPTSAKLLGMAVGVARKHLAWRSLAALEALLNAALENNQDALIEVGAMFLLLSANVSQKAHRVAAHNGFEAYVARGRHAERPAPRPLDGRKLRVGYLSSDLRGHAIGFLSVGVLEAHRESAHCEFYAYANWTDDGSTIRKRMRAAFTKFVNVTELSDAALAERIREDGIDVLVDLNQMTAGNRIGVFCHGPAPVTVQWLGMPGTVGAGERIDYVLLDPWTGHPGNLDGFDEQPVILAGSYQPNDHERPDLSLGKTRADWKLPPEAPVFCSFNQTQKFSPDTLALWAQILAAVPDAVLWVLAGDPTLEARFTRIFNDAGIASSRILFAAKVPHDVHIARLAHADLMLDNWPYNAHTTCSDALRAGTPVLTLPGATFASRVAAGILETAGLAEWIATSPEDYVAKAVAYAKRSKAERDAIKAEVAARYWASPMVDTRAFARRLEGFYLAAHARALAGERPTAAWVDAQGRVTWSLPPESAWRETVNAGLALPGGAPAPQTQAPAAAAQGPAAQREASAAATRAAAATQAAATEPPAAAGAAPALTRPWFERIARGSADARLRNLKLLRDEVLQLAEPPLLIDIGAAAFSWDPQRFDALVDAGLLKCLGFEPDEDSFTALQKKQAPHRHYVKKAVGNGLPGVFHVCNGAHMNSLLPPNTAVLEDLMGYQTCKVLRTVPIETVALDDVPEARGAAMIKLDTQGTELEILQHAVHVLESAVVLQFEAATLQTYQGAPSLFTIGAWLESQGFVMHSLAKMQKGRYVCPLPGIAPQVQSQLLEVDPVFIPSPLRWSELSAQRLLNLAYLMHALYHAHDAAMRALWTLDDREGGGRARAYANYLQRAGLDA